MKQSVRRFFGLDEDDHLEEQATLSSVPHEGGNADLHAAPLRQESYESGSYISETSRKPNVIPMGQRSTGTKASIHILEPRVYSESEEIAELLLRGEAVLLNFRRMEEEAASRILDFLQGAVYALRGSVQEAGEGIFLFVPANVEINGIDQNIYEDNFY